MTNKELKQKFPIGKLYQIKIHCGIFSALVNKSYKSFSCEDTIFLLLSATGDVRDSNMRYINVDALFSSGEVGIISLVYPEELILL
jgi:hypothetical protein